MADTLYRFAVWTTYKEEDGPCYWFVPEMYHTEEEIIRRCKEFGVEKYILLDAWKPDESSIKKVKND